MKHFLKYSTRLVFVSLIGFFLFYCLFLCADRRWHPDLYSWDSERIEGTLRTGVELEGETLLFDYAVTQYSDLESLVAASDRILIGEYGYDGQFTPSDALKGNLGGPFPIHFPDEPTFPARVTEEGETIDITLTAPSPLRLDFDKARTGPRLVFLRYDSGFGYVPVGDPWIADVYTNEALATRSQLSGSYEIAVTAEGVTEQHCYRKKVVYQNLSRPKTDEFLNDLTVQDIRNAAQK